jgi:hypothetical protein
MSENENLFAINPIIQKGIIACCYVDEMNILYIMIAMPSSHCAHFAYVCTH